jgi:hypothetical protein
MQGACFEQWMFKVRARVANKGNYFTIKEKKGNCIKTSKFLSIIFYFQAYRMHSMQTFNLSTFNTKHASSKFPSFGGSLNVL